mgnify:CR=1 FL=1
MDITVNILLTIATAATPLLIAAIGELVVERSGVLNLGVEGMMIIGAAVGFAVGFSTDNAFLGVIAAILAGMALVVLSEPDGEGLGDVPPFFDNSGSIACCKAVAKGSHFA